MPLPRSIALAITAALVTAVLPATATAAPPSPAPRPDNPVSSGTTGAAERALDAVQAAFQRSEKQGRRPAGVGVRDGELTQQMVQLRLGLDELGPQDRQLAEAFLARPTNGTEWYGANYSDRAAPTRLCGPEVCVHYATRTEDAPPAVDDNRNEVPDQVEKTREIMHEVWNRMVRDGGYDAPLPDGKKGGDSRLDVYLVDIGWDGLYGYCSPEYLRSGRSAPAYCVLDDDFDPDQYGANTPPLGNLQVTAAHEFFHAVQFAYDVREDPWLLESTATWVEDEIYDDVDDNLYFLPDSALRVPKRPLDTPAGSFMYGNWIWWRYLTETFTATEGLPVLVRRAWELADNSAGGTYSMKALDRALTEQGVELPEVFADFSTANRRPASVYEEGADYRKAPLSGNYELTESRRSISWKSRDLPHMSSTTVAFRPTSGHDVPGWKLSVQVDLPRRSQDPVARLAIFYQDGTVVERSIGLSRKGNGRVRTRFDSALVRQVELTMVNANHSYDCNRQTQWSCSGKPSPTRPFRFQAWSAFDGY